MIEDNQSCFDVITQLAVLWSSINSTMGIVI